MNRALFLSLILFFCFALRADRLDDVARQLDLLEKEYWRAQRSSDGEYHKSVEKRLLKFKVDVYRIIDQLRKVRKHHLVRFDEALNVLVGNFGRIRPLVIQAFRFDFKGTAMSDYTRDYREYLKDKEEDSEEEQGDKK